MESVAQKMAELPLDAPETPLLMPLTKKSHNLSGQSIHLYLINSISSVDHTVQTRPFFELQIPDFAWNFIWSVQPNYRVQKYKNTKMHKMQI